MYCPVCGKDMPTRAEMRGSATDAAGAVGVVTLCAKGHVIPDQVDDLSGFVDGNGDAADDAPVQFTPPGAKKARAQTSVPQSSKPLALTPRDALKLIKSRRREIRTEVARLEALRLEDDELAAAEAAIEASRRAKKVRPIREIAS